MNRDRILSLMVFVREERAVYELAKKFTPELRRRMAKSGEALPDGSFPIKDLKDLHNAIHAIGRAKDPEAAKAHIIRRAKALGHPELLPKGWA